MTDSVTASERRVGNYIFHALKRSLNLLVGARIDHSVLAKVALSSFATANF